MQYSIRSSQFHCFSGLRNIFIGGKVEPRIFNTASLINHGNIAGRKAVAEILEAGLQAADPYENTRKLIRIEENKLTNNR
jgi:hypothetical protein